MTKSTTSRAVRGSLALAVLAVGLLPGLAHAAAPAVGGFNIKSNPMTPYTSGGVQYFGHIDGITNDTKITVTASDTFVTYTRTSKPTNVWYADDPGNGKSAGDFDGTINVTDLGTHDGTASTINFTVAASNSGGSSQPFAAPFQKLSADPQDIYNPALQLKQKPPANWCHVASEYWNGDCMWFQNPKDPNGGPKSGVGRVTILPQCPFVIYAGFPCQFWLPSGQGVISGVVGDAGSGQFYIGSEIKDVVVLILDSTGHVATRASCGCPAEFHNFLRTGTTAGYHTTIQITDYPPGSYTADVFAFDALGHKSNEAKSAFTIEPDGCPNPPIC
jgi:hypothetical protein